MTDAGTVLLMAPSVYHRLRWDHGNKEDVVRVAHRLFLAGSAFLGAGIVAAVFLVGDMLYGAVAGAASVCAVGLTVRITWYVLPTSRADLSSGVSEDTRLDRTKA